MTLSTHTQAERTQPLIEVEGLRKWFPIRTGFFQRHTGDVKAVDGVSFRVDAGETLALVGESGCGKTTAARALLNLIEPTGGRAFYHDRASRRIEILEPVRPRRPWLGGLLLGAGVGLILHAALLVAQAILFAQLSVPLLAAACLRIAFGAGLCWAGARARWPPRNVDRLRSELSIVFQDPYESLNPRMSVGEIVAEGLRVHRKVKRSAVDARVAELFEAVGLNAEDRERFPHEFSGGQRQRVGIARALAVEPRFLVCDEAVSALDVSIQAQIINLLADLQRDLGLSYLFIAHDLGVVRHLADRVCVMYLGRLVEQGTTEDVFERPQHPYTKALLSAVPSPDPKSKKARILLAGDVPSPISPPSGCHFRTRCPLVEERCSQSYPETVRLSGTHSAACFLLDSPPSPPSPPA